MLELLQSFVVGAVTLGALSYLAKKIVSHWLDKDVERFKERVRSDAEAAIEQIRTDLRKDEFVFRSVYQRRADVLGELYSRMASAVSAVGRYVESAPVDEVSEELFTETQSVVQEFAAYFEQNRIWMSSDLAERVEDFLSVQNKKIFYRFRSVQTIRSAGLGDGWSDTELHNLWRVAKEEAPRVLREIEDQFRSALAGVCEARAEQRITLHNNLLQQTGGKPPAAE